jgi:putative ABC transport system permease protein
MPKEMVHNEYPRGSHWANAIGRLKPGATLKEAQADLTVIASALEKSYPNSNYKVGAKVVGFRENLVGNARSSLLLMLWAVALVLLIACANVANLLLSRAVGRQKEMALRSALGAGRARLVRQLLTESVLLGVGGGVAGLGLGWAIIRLFAGARSSGLPQFNVIELNWTVLAFTFALALGTGVLFGLVPAVQASRTDLHDELKGGAGSLVSPSKRRRFASDVLVVGEIALSLLLLAGAGLLLNDFVRLRNVEVGVRPEGVWTGSVHLPLARYEKMPQQAEFARALLEKARQIPGVEVAAITDHLPLEGGSNGYVEVRGQPYKPLSGPLVETHTVSADYFRAMGVRVLAGRVFSEQDVAETIPMSTREWNAFMTKVKLTKEETNSMIYPAVINEAMAKHFWHNESSLGKMFSWGSENGPWHQVIGVVSDVKQWGLTQVPIPEAYEPFSGRGDLFLVMHSGSRPAGLTAAARRAVSQLDSSLPLSNVRSMSQVIGDGAQGSQFLSLLVGSFAAFAALLAAVGIYGVLSYVVNQRTREIGIRMSLGASRGRVLGQVLAEGMRLAAIGSVIGVVAAIAAGRLMASLLHEVKPGDPMVLAGTTLLLVSIALVACYLPARRAARLDPLTALRHE